MRKRTWKSGGRKRTAWVLDYTDTDGRRQRLQFPDEEQAKTAKLEIEKELTKGRHVSRATSGTVLEACKSWLRDCEKRTELPQTEGGFLHKSTLRQRQLHVDHISRYPIAATKCCDVKKETVKAFHDDMRDAKTTHAMRKKILTNLAMIMDHADDLRWSGKNEVRKYKMPKGAHTEKTEMLIPEKEELSRIVEATGERYKLPIIFSALTGLRQSELRALRWADVDLDSGIIRVGRKATETGEILLTKTGGSEREVPIDPWLVGKLREWMVECPHIQDRVVDDLAGEVINSGRWLVFPTKHGTMQSGANLNNRGFALPQGKLGLLVPKRDGFTRKPIVKDGEVVQTHKYHWHCLRHYAASLFIEADAKPKRLQAIMGHTKITTTMDIYGHLFKNPEEDRELASKVTAHLAAQF